MYTVCAFETAWHRPRHDSGSKSSYESVWCNFFDVAALEALEFFEDLEYYWNDGYGYELTHRIACPAIADMFAAIRLVYYTAKSLESKCQSNLVSYT